MKKSTSFLSYIIVFLFLAGCVTENPVPASPPLPSEGAALDAQQSEDGIVLSYPVDEAYPSAQSGYPGQQAESANSSLSTEMLAAPEPTSSDTGTVTGVLKLRSASGSDPVPEAILYLGSVITLDDGSPALGAINKQIAPNTQTHYTGQFIFENVPVGQYVIAFDQITATFVLNSPNGEGNFIIDVNGGEILDLGELIYSDLPISKTE